MEAFKGPPKKAVFSPASADPISRQAGKTTVSDGVAGEAEEVAVATASIGLMTSSAGRDRILAHTVNFFENHFV